MSMQFIETKKLKIIRRVNANQASCLACAAICIEKFVFVPCGEEQFCDTCSETIVAEENPKCPSCNQDVNFRLRLHQRRD